MFKKNINHFNILFLLAMVVELASCHVTKNIYAPPKIDTLNILRNDGGNNLDTATIANIPWKEYFKDPKLQALIGEGLKNNIDQQIALTRIKEAEATLDMSRASTLPYVMAGAQVNATRISSGSKGTKILGYNSNSNFNSLGFSASWEADLWGKLSNQTQAKYASYLSSNEYKNLVQTTLIANIAKAYYNLSALDEQLKVTKQTIILLQKSAQTISDLKKSGQQNEAAVEQSNALLYNTQLTVPSLESQIRQQENAICLLLGRYPGPIDRDSISIQTVSDHLDYGVPAQLLSKRPDVKQAELSLRSAYALTNVAQANFYPSFTISSATFGLAAGGFTNFFKPENLAAELIAGITQPVFNKKQLKGNLKIAQSQQEEAMLNFRNTVLSAGQEVSNILFSYESSLHKNDFRNKQIESLKRAVDFTQSLLLAGEANYTEVLTAEQNLLSAQLSQVEDKLEQLTYSVSLYKALGGGTK